eukprot:TRINITY_DN1426_c0_g3_i1.p1 TRINITY_DN1426_c0_g3~~TRINITY_DN1426_c0_g3_i1.p1  ORF type:complete len:678 (+),score=72.02 TRINITY_DN1426_c0_g3_i1:123-2156(+)
MATHPCNEQEMETVSPTLSSLEVNVAELRQRIPGGVNENPKVEVQGSKRNPRESLFDLRLDESSVQMGGTLRKRSNAGAAFPLGRITRVRVGGSVSEVNLLVPDTLRDKVYALFDPGMPAWSVRSAQVQTVMSMVVFIIIMISVIVFCIESLPQYYLTDDPYLYWIEATCVLLFTLELIVRIVTVRSKKKFVKDPLNIIDVVAIVPWYVSLVMKAAGSTADGAGSLVVLRVIRLVRVFRVLKLSKYSTNLQLVGIAVSKSIDALSLLLFLIVICLVLFSSAIFIAEQTEMSFNSTDKVWYHNGKPAPLQSIPHSFWWCIVTITTVGYGDVVPKSDLGKVVASLAMLCGILVVAFPVILVGNTFNEAHSDHKRKTKKHLELLKRAFGDEAKSSSDNIPTMTRCTQEIEEQIFRFKENLSTEFRRRGIRHMFANPTQPEPAIGGMVSRFRLDTPGNSLTAHYTYLVSTGSGSNTTESLPLLESLSESASVVKGFNRAARNMEIRQLLEGVRTLSWQFRYNPVLSVKRIVPIPALHMYHIIMNLDSTDLQESALESLHDIGYTDVGLHNITSREVSLLKVSLPLFYQVFEGDSFSASVANPQSQCRLELKIPEFIAMEDAEVLFPFSSLEIDIIYSCHCAGHPLFAKFTIPLQGVEIVGSKAESAGSPLPDNSDDVNVGI